MLLGYQLRPRAWVAPAALALCLGFTGPLMGQGTTVEAQAPKYYAEGLQGVDLTGLTEAQKELALQVLNGSDCNCGCGMTVAQCRVEDQNCPRSPILARAIVDAIRRGEDEAGARAAYEATAAATGGRAKTRAPAQERPVFDIPVDQSAVRGPASAPVTIVEFSDFECPFCSRAAPIVRGLLADFDGQVRLAFKHLPLPFHAQARLAAAAAEAARKQGKFWEMHDLLFENTRALQRENLLEYARQLGLDLARFEADLEDPEISALIEKDESEARRVGANGTPSFYVNGRRVPNYQAATFRKAIKEAMAEANGQEGGGQ